MNLQKLRAEVKYRVSEKRFLHILAVERCAERLGALLMPEKLKELKAAAILHDVTKEINTNEQISILEKSYFNLTEEDKTTIGVLHSFSAPIIIKRDFPEFATESILSAVFKHTLGDPSMSIFDKIIFVSDYAEDTRKYASCISVREKLFSNFEKLTKEEALVRLDEAFIAAIDGTIEALAKDNKQINSRIYNTKKSLTKN